MRRKVRAPVVATRTRAQAHWCCRSRPRYRRTVVRARDPARTRRAQTRCRAGRRGPSVELDRSRRARHPWRGPRKRASLQTQAVTVAASDHARTAGARPPGAGPTRAGRPRPAALPRRSADCSSARLANTPRSTPRARATRSNCPCSSTPGSSQAARRTGPGPTRLACRSGTRTYADDMDIRRLGSGDGALLRDIRLRALEEAPYAFSSWYAREAALGADFWTARVAESASRDDRRDLRRARRRPRRRDGGCFLPDDSRADALLWGMWVEPSARQRGVGRELLRAVAAWARRGRRRAAHTCARPRRSIAARRGAVPRARVRGNRRVGAVGVGPVLDCALDVARPAMSPKRCA